MDVTASKHATGDLLVFTGPGILKAVGAVGNTAVIRDGTDATGEIAWEQGVGSTSGLNISLRVGLFIDIGSATGVSVEFISSA